MLIEPTPPYPPPKVIFRWVKSASESVTNYYGRFPVPRVLIRITPFEGRGVADGMTFGDRGGRSPKRGGTETSPPQFASRLMLYPPVAPLAFSFRCARH